MDFKQYCYNPNSFEFEIDEMKFVCDEITVGEDAQFFNYYIEKNGRHNLARLGLCRATKLKETPFTVEWINHLIKVDKTWNDLSSTERLGFLEKLEISFAGKILKSVNEHYSDTKDQIKNS